MYHRFSNTEEKFKLSKAALEQQLVFLIKNYNIISLRDYVDVLEKKRGKLPNNSVIITIDDGYRDNYEYAYPLLKKYGIPATIFLTTDFVTNKSWLWADLINYILKKTDLDVITYKNNLFSKAFDIKTPDKRHQAQLSLFNYFRSIDNDAKNNLLIELADKLHVNIPTQVTADYQPLTWEQIREMNNNGIDFGSHTCTHPICSRLKDDSLKYELIESKKEIERHLNIKADFFCYPNGQPEDLNNEVIVEVRKAGYRGAVTTSHGYNGKESNVFYLNRLSCLSVDYKIISRVLTRV
jgi:peptidoglycan/xylan/chitin deacetylase (PgdA/CDA1 family)